LFLAGANVYLILRGNLFEKVQKKLLKTGENSFPFRMWSINYSLSVKQTVKTQGRRHREEGTRHKAQGTRHKEGPSVKEEKEESQGRRRKGRGNLFSSQYLFFDRNCIFSSPYILFAFDLILLP